MKSIQTKLLTIAATLAFVASAGTAPAARVTIDGAGFYELSTTIKYYGGGVKQSGRYGNLGADYYRSSTVGADWIVNRSPVASGNLSFEFWGMPYYGANQGIVLMSRGLRPYGPGGSSSRVRCKGYSIYLDELRFPEINLWEFTRLGWRWRDALTFKRRIWL